MAARKQTSSRRTTSGSARKKANNTGGSPQAMTKATLGKQPMPGLHNISPAQARNFISASQALLPTLQTIAQQSGRGRQVATG